MQGIGYVYGREYFDRWMQCIMDRFDQLEKLQAPPIRPRAAVLPDGEKLLDNSDLCHLLNVSKRTIQRYRSSGELPFQRIKHKTFYKESEVRRFIEDNFDRFRKIKKKTGFF